MGEPDNDVSAGRGDNIGLVAGMLVALTELGMPGEP